MLRNETLIKIFAILAVIVFLMFATGNWFLAILVIACAGFVYVIVKPKPKEKPQPEEDFKYDYPIGPKEHPDKSRTRFLSEYSDKISEFFSVYPKVLRWWGSSIEDVHIVVKGENKNLDYTGFFTFSPEDELLTYEAYSYNAAGRSSGHFTLFENKKIKEQQENLAKSKIKDALESGSVKPVLEKATRELSDTEKCTLNFHKILDPASNEYNLLCTGFSAYAEGFLSDYFGDNVKVKCFSPGIYKAEAVRPLHLKESNSASYKEIEGYLKTAKDNIAAGSPDASLSLCFKSVEIIVKNLSKETGLPYDSREVPLIDMIDSLYRESVITEEQKKMLHRARSSGNIGKHTDLDNAVSDDEKMSRAKEAVDILEKLLLDFA